MIVVVNKGLNKKGVKEMNKFLKHKKKILQNQKYVNEMSFWGIHHTIEDCKYVKVGDKIGKSYKVFKRGLKSITDVTTMGCHLGIGVLLDYIDYEVIEI